MGASVDMMISNLNEQTYMSKLKSHWLPFFYLALCHI